MSGKDLEPLTTFFPSIDRNLIADLDRHLRGTRVEAVDVPVEPATLKAPAPTPNPAPSAGRMDISGVLEAVEHAAASMTSMAERIDELERSNHDLDERYRHIEAANQALTLKLAEVTHQHDAAVAALQAESERIQRLESVATHHVSRATGLERELGVARADLAKVVEAITQALGAPGAAQD